MKPWVALLIAALVIALAGAWIAYERAHVAPSAALQEEFDWSFVDLGVSAASSMPETQVSLKIAGVNVPLGMYMGECFSVAGSPWPLLQDELSAAVCTWHGAGKEIGVFNSDGNLVLRQGDVTESSSSLPIKRENFSPITKQP